MNIVKKAEKDVPLVATDFFAIQSKLYYFVGQLAQKLKAPLLVFHVIQDSAEAPGFYAQKGKKKKFIQSMEEAAEEMMAVFLKRMRKAYPTQMPIQEAIPLLVIGTPVTQILEIAKKKKAYMIIIGSHGRTGLSHMLVGSKAERVVQLSPIPVTVVKSSTKK